MVFGLHVDSVGRADAGQESKRGNQPDESHAMHTTRADHHSLLRRGPVCPSRQEPNPEPLALTADGYARA